MDNQKFDFIILELTTIKQDIKEVDATLRKLELEFMELSTKFKIRTGIVSAISSAVMLIGSEVLRHYYTK